MVILLITFLPKHNLNQIAKVELVYTDQLWIFTQLIIIIYKIFKKTGKNAGWVKTMGE
jgi:hypothetical protein